GPRTRSTAEETMSYTRIVRVLAAIVAVNSIGLSGVTAAQQPPPIHGVTGTIATDETIQETDAAGHKIVGKVRRFLHLSGKTTAAGADPAGEEALNGLKQGTRVVLHSVESV